MSERTRPASPGLHLGLRCCFLGCGGGRRPMRRVAELCWGAALVAQRRVGALGQVQLRVLPLGLLLLLLEAGQAEEEAEDGFQITIPDLCMSGRTAVIIINHHNDQNHYRKQCVHTLTHLNSC